MRIKNYLMKLYKNWHVILTHGYFPTLDTSIYNLLAPFSFRSSGYNATA